MICENCNHEVTPRIWGGWNAGGMKQVVKKCPCCNENICKTRAFYSYKDFDFDRLPILYDDRTKHKCEVEGCTNYVTEGTMLHHFFPKFLFGALAELSPKSYLCKTHHMDEWHAKLTPNMSKKDLD